ncbi:MAG: anti-sigma factor family protein [Gemmatimonadota bacterium]
MNQLNCEYIIEVYPDLLNGGLDAARALEVRAHVASCDECRADTALLDALHGEAVHLPDALRERVVQAALHSRPRRRISGGELAMVATLVLGLIGGGLLMRKSPAPPAPEAESGLGFVTVESAMLSGKASLEDFTVEELEQLLGEIDS